jgi:hypothetical protein
MRLRRALGYAAPQGRAALRTGHGVSYRRQPEEDRKTYQRRKLDPIQRLAPVAVSLIGKIDNKIL